MKGSSQKIVVGVITVSTALAVVCGFFMFRSMKPDALPVLGQVKPFLFTSGTGEPFDSKQLYRNVWIAGIFSTPCENGCDKLMTNMASLSRTFEQVPAVKLVAVTVDPQTDTAARLSEFSGRYVQGKGNWYFLTGGKPEIEAFYRDQLKVSLASQEAGYSPTLVLVDRSGFVRGYYDGTVTDNVNRLFVDASRLLKDRF